MNGSEKMGVRKMGTRRTGGRMQRVNTLLGLFVGMVLGFFVTARLRYSILSGSIAVAPFGCGGLTQQKRSLESASMMGDDNNDYRQHDRQPEIIGSDDARNGRTLIFVGVMTAQKYLDTRAVGVYETWAQTLPGRVAFFSSFASQTTANIPLVRLPGVDDVYPPQKKSFLMLKYMHDHFLDKFEWFMRADDDVYVRGNKLEVFLRSINSSQMQFIGQAGMGNKEEFGQLSLEDDENFCMGGPGMILSRETLRRLVPQIKVCLKNLFSTHEDVEIGRCVRKFAGIPCTWSYEMQNLFYHNSSGWEAFTGKLKQKEVHRAITLHPVKQHEHMYRMHDYMEGLRIQELHQDTLALLRDIRDISFALKEPSTLQGQSDPDVLGKGPNLNKFAPSNGAEVATWDFFTRVIFSHANANPKRKVESPIKESLEDVVTEIMEMINKFSQQRGRVIDFKELLYGYKRVVPMYGADYILDMLLVYKKYRGRKMTVPVRRHAYLQQAFTPIQVRELLVGTNSDQLNPEPLADLVRLVEKGLNRLSYNEIGDLSSDPETLLKNTVIHFILPLADRYSTFQRFVTNYEDVCLQNLEKVALTVVLFHTTNNSGHEETMQLVKRLQKAYPGHEFNIMLADGSFSRSLALELGAGQHNPEALLFFLDVDMHFDRESLARIRLNTVQGRQVYYPIVFSQYDPSVVYGHEDKVASSSQHEFLVSQNTGYWRQFGFGIVAMYKIDLMIVGGFDTTIQGWGREDVDLFDKIVRSNLTIFRAVDPGLVHVFHDIDCDVNINPSQLQMCLGTKANSYGSTRMLSDIVYNEIVSNDEGSLPYE